jgi:hypothetical protein
MDKMIFSIEEIMYSPEEIIFEENDKDDNSLYIIDRG